MKADYHLHTSFSSDSETPMEDSVKRGIELGLDEMCFTEHVDYGVKTDTNCPYDQYFKKLAEMQEKYDGIIKIKKGIEFGIQTHTVDLFEKDFAKYDFDFVILSNHQMDDKELWTYEYQPGKSQEEYNMNYYNEILNVMKIYKNYSVLGHLDSCKRYDTFGEYPDDNIIPIVTDIMKLAIADGKGIEINTGCFRYKLSDLTPSRRLLKLYKELGGEIITLGSDAHDTSFIADHFDEVSAELREMGYKHIYTYEKMQPSCYDL